MYFDPHVHCAKRNGDPVTRPPNSLGLFHAKRALHAQTTETILLFPDIAPDVPAGGMNCMAGIATIAASLELCGWSPSADWPLAWIYNWRSYALTAPESHESRPWIWKLLGHAASQPHRHRCFKTSTQRCQRVNKHDWTAWSILEHCHG